MECSMCGDLGFQVYLFECTKCLWRLQHQYCSRAYFDNVPDCKLCDWCYSIQKEEGGSKFNFMKDSVGLEESMGMTHGKVKRNLRNCCADIDCQIPKEQKKQKKSELVDKRVRKRYKLLDEIMC